MIISPPVEFRFTEALHFLKRSPKELLHQVNGDHVYKLLNVDGKHVLIRISSPHKNIKIELLTDQSERKINSSIRQYIIDWFDLDKDLKPFYKLAKKDTHLGPLVKKYYGYRIVGQPDLYESLIWAVLGQQINLSFAYTLKQAFVKKYGMRLLHDHHDYYLFPLAADVSLLKQSDLLELQFSRQKAEYVIAISKAFESGVISADKLRGLPLSAAKDELIQIKGIGNWTANYALMKTFRYSDAFPKEDAGLKNAVRQCLQLDRHPSLAEIENFFKPYKGWEAYATLYLWRSL